MIIGRMSCITGRVGTRCGINALKANMREREVAWKLRSVVYTCGLRVAAVFSTSFWECE
jgi:hypothetical protein